MFICIKLTDILILLYLLTSIPPVALLEPAIVKWVAIVTVHN